MKNSVLKEYLNYLVEVGIDGLSETYLSGKDREDKIKLKFDDIYKDWIDCKRCKLSATRTKIVFGDGNVNSKIMFIGEGPGRDEDLQGKPFVGKAGQLLTEMLRSIGLKREDVFITNIVKCRPPNNRDPEKDEITACYPLLEEQISLIDPALIVTLGKPAIRVISGENLPITKIHGKIMVINGRKVLPTFHPAFLLRNSPMKKEAWKDLLVLKKFL